MKRFNDIKVQKVSKCVEVEVGEKGSSMSLGWLVCNIRNISSGSK